MGLPLVYLIMTEPETGINSDLVGPVWLMALVAFYPCHRTLLRYFFVTDVAPISLNAWCLFIQEAVAREACILIGGTIALKAVYRFIFVTG